MKRWCPAPTGSCTGFLRGEIETEHVLPDVSYIIFPVRDEILVILTVYDNDPHTYCEPPLLYTPSRRKIQFISELAFIFEILLRLMDVSILHYMRTLYII